MEKRQAHPTSEEDWHLRIRSVLRRVAVALSVFDPDHPLHDHLSEIGARGAELNPEGLGHLADVATLVTETATGLAELEFRTTSELPEGCREALSEAREGTSELSWILWGVSIALESPDTAGEPPGRPGEILIRCSTLAAESYSTSMSREGGSSLRGEREKR